MYKTRISLVLAARIKIDLCEKNGRARCLCLASTARTFTTYSVTSLSTLWMEEEDTNLRKVGSCSAPKITKEFLLFCDLLSVLSNSKQFVPKTMEVDPVHPFWIQNKEKHSLVQLIFWENLGCPYNTYIFNISHLRPTGPLQLPSLRAAISISRFERHEEWLRFSRVMICRAPYHHLTLPNMSGWGVSWGNLHGVRKNRWGALSLSTSNTKV